MTEVYEHWTISTDEENICWLTLDRQGTSVNSLNEAVLTELNQIIDWIEKQKDLKSIIICSGKKTGFIAGADIEQFKSLKNVEMAVELIQKGAQVFDRLEALTVPTIAMISGFCLGGGLELALACRYRIALEDDKTRLGLPEVKLGIHPGWGGTVRLPALIGAPAALDLILSGRTLRAKAAAKMGVIDAAVPMRLFKQTVQHFAKTQPAKKPLKGFKAWSNHALFRLPIAYMIGKTLRKKAKREHYPAPYAVVDNWVENGIQGRRPFQVEIESIGRLLLSDTSKNLVNVFFAQEHLKGLAPRIPEKAQHVHVVGAGVMGGAIAAWCAFRGLTVTLQDPQIQSIAQSVKSAYKLAKKRLKTTDKVMRMMDRFIPDPSGEGVANADVIIEAVSENLELKKTLFKTIESKARPEAVLATNTSTICLESIGAAMQQPERLVGIHFFNPVAQMPLVEVVKADNTDTQVVNKAMAFVKAIDKLPLPVKSAPGFLVNRILMPYMLEAVSLLEEGIPGEVIDAAALQFGMPMGPIVLADTVGLDICLAALESMADSIEGTVPQGLKDKVQKGLLGQKTGQGYYEWKNGKPKTKKTPAFTKLSEITDRLVLRMVNESMACLREGIVEDETLLNAGSIFGFGFPPFRGGIAAYVEQRGKEKLKTQLDSFFKVYGDRFKADPYWEKDGHMA